MRDGDILNPFHISYVVNVTLRVDVFGGNPKRMREFHFKSRARTLTNTEGVYVLNLLFAKPRFKTIKYEITIDETKRGFEKFVLKNFNFIQSTNGKMQLDFALDSLNPEPCGYSGGDCINNTQTPLKLEKTKVSTKILQTPLEKLPKKQIKTKRKIINNKQ